MPKEAVNYLEMSDEEFMALPESSFTQAAAEDEEAPSGAEESEGVEEQAPADGEDSEPESEAEEEEGTEPETPAEQSEESDDKKSEQPEAKSEEPAPTEEIDYKAAYERITGSFKANGKEMKVDSIDDAVRLMQMGANYNRKMAALKPNLKLMKTLENAGITEEKLNHLIDLDKKDPVAIARLIKDAGLDPLDIDMKGVDSYKAANHSANETEMALDEVISEIKDSPHYNATLALVATKWDANSKQAVVDSPQLLKVINDHMASGVYDLISTEMEKERVFGRLSGMSDLNAYKHVGDAIQARGGFDHLFQPEQRQRTNPPVNTVPGKVAADEARKNKKRAAGSPKAAPTADTTVQDFNPLAMSDEEFAKHYDSKYK